MQAGRKVDVRMRVGGITGGRSETSLLVGGTLLPGEGDGGHQDKRLGGRVEGQHPPRRVREGGGGRERGGRERERMISVFQAVLSQR